MTTKRFMLARQGPKTENFSKVVICDTAETVPGTINGIATRKYKSVSDVMDYLDAYPIMVELNGKESEQ